MAVPFGDRLRDELGPPRRARLLDSSPRSAVWRVELVDGTAAVVKQLVAGEAAGETTGAAADAAADERYRREITALRSAGRVRPAVVPRLLGTDPDARVLVLEHVEHRTPAQGWQIEYAQGLARLHAAATGDETELPRWTGPGERDVTAFLAFARRLGATVPAAAEDDLGALVHRLGAPAVRSALLHGDPCPGNDLHTPDGIRFVDFEQACLGNGLMELAYLRIGFPTCWCVTDAAGPLLSEAEEMYRTTWRAVTGTEVAGDLADACAGWLIRGDALVERARRGTVDRLARAVDEDWTWGTVTARERLLHRLGVVAGMTEGHEALGALGALAGDVRDRVRQRWPRLGTVPTRRPSS
ncbi:phosphotransferase family protein [Streptomyces sp. NBC_00467]|uniref:phosphotransferase family protein n=1 Tax=Streptomyces sp. NBC_00467 TaxID=2975752 RepID=UPI002E19FDCB